MARIILIHKRTWAVINCDACDMAIIGVHNTMDKPDAHPLRDQFDLPFNHSVQKTRGVACQGIMATDSIIKKCLEIFMIQPRCKVFKGANAQMAACDAGQYRARLRSFTIDSITCCDGCQSACRRDPQVIHSLGHNEFAQNGAKPCTPVATA